MQIFDFSIRNHSANGFNLFSCKSCRYQSGHSSLQWRPDRRCSDFAFTPLSLCNQRRADHTVRKFHCHNVSYHHQPRYHSRATHTNCCANNQLFLVTKQTPLIHVGTKTGKFQPGREWRCFDHLSRYQRHFICGMCKNLFKNTIKWSEATTSGRRCCFLKTCVDNCGLCKQPASQPARYLKASRPRFFD